MESIRPFLYLRKVSQMAEWRDIVEFPSSDELFKIKVVFNPYLGKMVLDVRNYYEEKETGDIKPGAKGVSFDLVKFDHLLDVFNRFGESIREALVTQNESLVADLEV